MCRPMTRAGIKGLFLDQWIGIFVPPGTPPNIIARLNGEIGKALADPAVRKKLMELRAGADRRYAGAIRRAGSRTTSPNMRGW